MGGMFLPYIATWLASSFPSNVTVEKLPLNHHLKNINKPLNILPLSFVFTALINTGHTMYFFFHWILGYMRTGTVSVLFTAISLVLYQCMAHGGHSLCSEYVNPQVKVMQMGKCYLLLASFMSPCRPQRHFVGNLGDLGTYLQTMT